MAGSAIVTGGAGIGLALARQLVAWGLQVLLERREAEALRGDDVADDPPMRAPLLTPEASHAQPAACNNQTRRCCPYTLKPAER